MQRLIRPLAALLFILVCVIPASVAHAHAELDDATPAADAVLTTAPTEVLLQFNEPVRAPTPTVSFVSATVTVDAAAVADGATLTLTPSEPLGVGTWSVLWRVVSQDGHDVAGVHRFSVGAPTEAVPIDGVMTGVWVDRILELLAWVGFAFAAAAALYGLSALRTAASIAVGASLLRVIAIAEGLGAAVFSAGEARAAAATALAAAALWISRPTATVPAAIGLFASQGLFSGHHLLETDPLLRTAHPLHLAAAALWSAALIGMLRAPERMKEQSRHATMAIAVLVPAVLALVASMLYPFNTPGRWEWTVLAKAAATAAALALGWVNHRALRTSSDSRAVHRRVLAEVALLTVVAVATASIASASPANTHRADTGQSNTAQDVSRSASVELVFDDGSTGRVMLDGLGPTRRASAMLFITPATAGVLVEGAEFELASADASVAGLTGSFVPMGDHLHGMFDLGGPGRYTLTVSLRIDAFSTVAATATFEVPSRKAAGDR